MLRLGLNRKLPQGLISLLTESLRASPGDKLLELRPAVLIQPPFDLLVPKPGP
jgi:hypothetical protein